jgi:hypothetical protein
MSSNRNVKENDELKIITEVNEYRELKKSLGDKWIYNSECVIYSNSNTNIFHI